ncbi:MAG TPA: SCO family protein [Vicinamibacterales bacterium]|jgi:protein SCO1/2
MRSMFWLRIAPVLVVACAVVAAVAFESVPAAADNSHWGANYFPNVTLTTHEGRQVHFYDDLVRGKIVAIDLIYTTCKYACPLETARLAQVQTLLGDRMGRDVFFYSITIDPDHDTPPVLKAYAEKYHAGPGWLFLTGKASDIELISRKLGLYTEPNPANKDGHTPSLLVGNETTGQWMRNSALDNPKFLARTIGDWLNSWKTSKPGVSYAEAPKLTLDNGQYAFSTHCAPCHSIGGGVKIGPDLAGVTGIRDRAWLSRFIVAPATMLAERDPLAVSLYEKYKPVQMPNLDLKQEDAADILMYLEKQGSAIRGTAAQGAIAAVPLPAGTDLQPIVAPYLHVQQELSSDVLVSVSENARVIASEAGRFGPGGEPIRLAAESLEHAVDLVTARAAFGHLGDALMTSARASNVRLVGPDVRVAYCPMAKKYWLQIGEEIRNPFYGKSMLDCGRIVAELPELR